MSATTKNANPAPLGLLGFGMTTVLLNLHNAGLLPLSIVIVAMGIALGGLAQIIAGVRKLKQGNTFAGTAFTAYGLSAIYSAVGQIVNGEYGKTVMPLG